MKMFVKSYDAIIARRASDGNAMDDARYLFLNGHEAETGNNVNFTIHFYETETGDMGTFHPESGAAVGLPVREYEDMYHMLQTESRIHANVEADENNKIIYFNMGTNDNPVGGGSPDLP